MRARGPGPRDRQRPFGRTGRAGGRSEAATRALPASARSQWHRPPTSHIEALFWGRAQHVIPGLQREVEIGPYRVDFLVPIHKLVIELYGYKWHASQEKRVSDARRERDLMRMGYRVMSFMGAEVTRDLDGCVRQTLQVLVALDDQTASKPVAPLKTVAVSVAAPAGPRDRAQPPRQPSDSHRAGQSLSSPRGTKPARVLGLSKGQTLFLVTLGGLFVVATIALGALVGLVIATLG